MVDAQDLGSCALCMGVRVPSLAPKKHCGSHSAFLLAVTFFAKADLSEIYRLPIVSTFEDLGHSFRICLTRVLRSASIEDGILSDRILLGKVQLLWHPIVFECQRDVHLLIQFLDGLLIRNDKLCICASRKSGHASEIGIARKADFLIELDDIRHQDGIRTTMRDMEDGADLICQAWTIFTKFEEEASSISCLRCGFENKAYSKVCDRCGARLVLPAGYQDPQEGAATVTNYTSQGEPEESDTSDHLSRLIEACDAAKFGRIAKAEFVSVLAWGKQLLRSASASLSKLPPSSDDPNIDKALHSLRQGVEEFRQGIDEMQWWADTGANSHLDIAAHILLQAYTHFVEVQEMAGN